MHALVIPAMRKWRQAADPWNLLARQLAYLASSRPMIYMHSFFSGVGVLLQTENFQGLQTKTITLSINQGLSLSLVALPGRGSLGAESQGFLGLRVNLSAAPVLISFYCHLDRI